MTTRIARYPVATIVVFMATSIQAQTTLILPPINDTGVGYHDNYNSANTNYNSAIHFSCISQPGHSGGVNKSRGLMQFDLSSIPSNATILGAFLSLSASGPIGIGEIAEIGSAGQNSAKLLRITSTWNDNTVTWNSQPSTTTINAVTLEQSTYSLQNYPNIDVTLLVQDMISDPTNSFGFMIKLNNETPSRGLCFYGGLAPEPDKRPSLVVVYGDCGFTNIVDLVTSDDFLTIKPSIATPGSTVHLDMGSSWPSTTSLVLLNAMGQVTYELPVSHWPISVTVPALAQGNYIWKVQGASGELHGVARMVIK